MHLSNPLLSPADFINYLAFSVFKKKTGFDSKASFLVEFEAFLKKCLQHQKTFILIIDEAHKLSSEILEEIRLLSNMETADEKLLNIFLAGQPELNEKLSHPECRALLQRISIRYHIEPLDLKGTQEYIHNRLKLAGAESGNKIFSTSVIKAIYEYSEGYPRKINILGDNVLLLGYARGEKKITPSMVRECHEDLQIEASQTKKKQPQPVREDMKPKTGKAVFKQWKQAALVVLLCALFIMVVDHYGNSLLRLIHGFARSLSHQASTDPVAGERNLVKQTIDQKLAEVMNAHASKKEKNGSSPLNVEKQSGQSSTVGALKKKIVMVKEGENLAALAADFYGRFDENVLHLIQKHNPQIENMDSIHVGQKINFPELPEPDQDHAFTVHIISYRPVEKAGKMLLELLEKGYKAYMIPVQNNQTEKVFRITLGNFKTAQEAKNYAEDIKRKQVSEYAEVVRLDVR